MCGIIGSINCRGNFEEALLKIRHRGPDGKGIEQVSCCGQDVLLGHTRLSILDLSEAGAQPMKSSNGSWWISYNGEIYNHLELRKQVDGQFRGHSDTETLVELLAAKGIESILSQLNGMFAFAALEVQTGKLYLVRDPFGIKPLYYCQSGNSFAFASEIKALNKMGLGNGGVDKQNLSLFLTLRYVPSPKTLWKNIHRLQPGHVLCVDINTGHTKSWRYVTPVKERFQGSLNDAVNAYQKELKTAIDRQLLSDVPVGLLLSGGIDSALVAAMAKDLGRDLPCFTVGFGDNHAECEIEDAKETARTLGLPISSVTVTPELLRDALPGIVRSIEEPLGTTSVMPMKYLVEHARENVTVVLTGQGSDEPWGGYRRYQMEMVRRLFPVSSAWRLVAGVAGIAPKIFTEVLERGLRALPVHNLAERAVEACALFSAKERFLLTGSSEDGSAVLAMSNWIDWLNGTHCEPAECMMRVDTRMNLADDLLLYGDKISMAVALEARVPMLDIDLVRFVESLPLHFRLALRRTKIVHKAMAEQYLPSSIVHRRKKGFQVPFGAWSRGPWKEFIEDFLLSSEAPHWTFLNRKGVRQLWSEHLVAKPDRSRQIFALLMLTIWWREFE